MDKKAFLKAGARGDAQRVQTHLVQARLGQTVERHYKYQFSYPYLQQSYGVMGSDSYDVHKIATSACQLRFVCQEGSHDCQVLRQFLRQTNAQHGRDCDGAVQGYADPYSALTSGNGSAYFGDLATLYERHQSGSYRVSRLPLVSRPGYVCRLDAFMPFNVKDTNGRSMGVFSLLISMALLLVGAVVLIIFGAGKG